MGGHHSGGHSGGGGHHGGGGGGFGWWAPPVYYVPELCYVNELGQRVCVDQALTMGDAGACCSGCRRGGPCSSTVSSAERAARARAERDPATRARITNAHTLIARAHGLPVQHVHVMHQTGRLGYAHAARAGLSRGEAAAAGIK